MNKRDVRNVLYFRNDISPFLVHLTRDTATDAKLNLQSMLKSTTLKSGSEGISDAKYGYHISNMTPQIKQSYFSAISFTETPINEIHNLLEIADRTVDLKPYGLVFLKENLKEKGVSPVMYINNVAGDRDALACALCSLINSHPKQAAQILPYIAVFGKMLSPLGGSTAIRNIDFTWEREWRYASTKHVFKFEEKDVFIGLCPDEDIHTFESMFPWLSFVDPQRNTKWYSEKLVKARQRSNLKYSVV